MRIYIFIVAIISLSACNRKSVPEKTEIPQESIVVHSDCDSLIQSAVDSIKKYSSVKSPGGKSDCSGAISLVSKVTKKLNESEKRVKQLEEQIKNTPTVAPVQVFKGKIKHSFNDIQRNSNNQTEINNLKNSLQLKDSVIATIEAENLMLNSRIKALKGSAVGDGNTIKNSKMSWWWIFLAGYLFCHVLHKILIPMIKGLNPFIGVTSRVASLFNKLNLFR